MPCVESDEEQRPETRRQLSRSEINCKAKLMLARRANLSINVRYSRSCSQPTKHKQAQHQMCAPVLGCSMRQIASQVAHPFPSTSNNVAACSQSGRASSPGPADWRQPFCQQNSVTHRSTLAYLYHQIPTCHQLALGYVCQASTTTQVRCTIHQSRLL